MLSASPEEVPIVMHSKYLAHIMMLGIVSSDGDVMEPVFILDGLHLGANRYVRLLDEHVKTLMDMVASEKPPYDFNRTLVLPQGHDHPGLALKNVPYHWSPHLWPPSSPNCNPLDYFVWGVLESEVNSRPYNNKEALKAAIRDAMTNVDRNTIAKACSSFQSRLEKVVAADGGLIE